MSANQKNNGIGKEDTEFDQFKIPADLNYCYLYYDASGIGIPTSRKCPYSQKFQKVKFSIFKNPFKITNFGNTIPLYFQFVLYALTLWMLIFLSCLRLGLRFRHIYCMNYFLKTKDTCKWYQLDSYLTSSNINLEDYKQKELSKVTTDNFLLASTAAYIMILYSFVFNWSQYKFIRKLQKDRDSSSAEFTVMVEKVNLDETRDPKRDITQYINQLLATNGYDCSPEMRGFNIATYEGIFNKIRYLKKELVEQQMVIKRYQKAAESAGHVRRAKIYDGLRTSISKKLHKLIKLEALRTKNSAFILESRKHAIAFITYSSNLERDHVLYSYKSLNKGILTKLSSICSKPSKYNIKIAPEPTNINWRFVGYSDSQRVTSFFTVKPLIYVLLPAFFMFYFALKYLVFIFLHRYTHIVEHTSITIANYLVVRVFTQFMNYIFDELQHHEKHLEKTYYLSRKAILVALVQFLFLYVNCIASSLTEPGVRTRNDSDFSDVNFEKLNFFRGKYLLHYVTVSIFLGSFLELCDFGFFYQWFLRWLVGRQFRDADEDAERIDRRSGSLVTSGVVDAEFEGGEIYKAKAVKFLTLQDVEEGRSREGTLKNDPKIDLRADSKAKKAKKKKKEKPSKYKLMTQKTLTKELFTRPKVEIDMMYSNMVFYLFLSAIFVYYSPILTLIILSAMVLKAATDLIIIYKRCRAPIYDSSRLSKFMVNCCLMVPKFLMLGYIQFMYQRVPGFFWGYSTGVKALIVFNLFIVCFPITWLCESFDVFLDWKDIHDDERKTRYFDKEKRFFKTDYRTENPSTAFEKD